MVTESGTGSLPTKAPRNGHDCLVSEVIGTALSPDIDSLGGVFRRASLSNERDRDRLLLHPESLVLSDVGVRLERTKVAVDFASHLIIGGVIEIEDPFVDPPRMRRGVGRVLVLDAVAIAGERSFDRLEVTANPHGEAFSERMGFVVDHVVETDFYPAHRMHCSIH
jgi:GNAT superfamily N-acetyltransferase